MFSTYSVINGFAAAIVSDPLLRAGLYPVDTSVPNLGDSGNSRLDIYLTLVERFVLAERNKLAAR
jgi:hypothetical protein